MNLERLGVTLACPPDLPIILTAASLSDLVLFLHLHCANLAKSNEVLQQVNPAGTNEQIAEVQAALAGMENGIGTTLAELLRVGQAQGLRLAAVGAAPRH